MIKAQSKLAEVEGSVKNIYRTAMASEKEKLQLQANIEELSMRMYDAQSNFVQMERKSKNFDKIFIK
jgi:hypothetical protein